MNLGQRIINQLESDDFKEILENDCVYEIDDDEIDDLAGIENVIKNLKENLKDTSDFNDIKKIVNSVFCSFDEISGFSETKDAVKNIIVENMMIDFLEPSIGEARTAKGVLFQQALNEYVCESDKTTEELKNTDLINAGFFTGLNGNAFKFEVEDDKVKIYAVQDIRKEAPTSLYKDDKNFTFCHAYKINFDDFNKIVNDSERFAELGISEIRKTDIRGKDLTMEKDGTIYFGKRSKFSDLNEILDRYDDEKAKKIIASAIRTGDDLYHAQFNKLDNNFSKNQYR